MAKIYYVEDPETGETTIVPAGDGGASSPKQAAQIAQTGYTQEQIESYGSWQPLTKEQQESIKEQQRVKTLTIIPREQAVKGLSAGALGKFSEQATEEERKELLRGTRYNLEVQQEEPQQQESWWSRTIEQPIREKITYPLSDWLAGKGITTERVSTLIGKTSPSLIGVGPFGYKPKIMEDISKGMAYGYITQYKEYPIKQTALFGAGLVTAGVAPELYGIKYVGTGLKVAGVAPELYGIKYVGTGLKVAGVFGTGVYAGIYMAETLELKDRVLGKVGAELTSWWSRTIEQPIREKVTYPLSDWLAGKGITSEKIASGVKSRIKYPWAYGVSQPYLTDATVGEYARSREPLAGQAYGFVKESIFQFKEYPVKQTALFGAGLVTAAVAPELYGIKYVGTGLKVAGVFGTGVCVGMTGYEYYMAETPELKGRVLGKAGTGLISFGAGSLTGMKLRSWALTPKIKEVYYSTKGLPSERIIRTEPSITGTKYLGKEDVILRVKAPLGKSDYYWVKSTGASKVLTPEGQVSFAKYLRKLEVFKYDPNLWMGDKTGGVPLKWKRIALGSGTGKAGEIFKLQQPSLARIKSGYKVNVKEIYGTRGQQIFRIKQLTDVYQDRKFIQLMYQQQIGQKKILGTELLRLRKTSVTTQVRTIKPEGAFVSITEQPAYKFAGAGKQYYKFPKISPYTAGKPSRVKYVKDLFKLKLGKAGQLYSLTIQEPAPTFSTKGLKEAIISKPPKLTIASEMIKGLVKQPAQSQFIGMIPMLRARTKTRDLEAKKQIYKLRQREMLMPETQFKIKVAVATRQLTRTKMMTASVQKTAVVQELIDLQRIITPPSVPTLLKPPKAPPIIPFIPKISFGLSDFMRKSKVPVRIRYGYTPSFTALMFNIRGKAGKSLIGERYTGFELRPITPKFRWRII